MAWINIHKSKRKGLILMLEMEAGPQKIAKGALMRRDIWERLQMHWLHARQAAEPLSAKTYSCARGPCGQKCGDHRSPHAGTGQAQEEGGWSLGSLLCKAAPHLPFSSSGKAGSQHIHQVLPSSECLPSSSTRPHPGFQRDIKVSRVDAA